MSESDAAYQQGYTRGQERERERWEPLREAIETWALAYPEASFPPISKEGWNLRAQCLLAAGYTLDNIAAQNMKHVITRLAELLP